MPTARDHLTAQTMNGRIYAVAGRAARDLNANEEYDPADATWRSRAPIPTARGGVGSAAVDGRMQVFGGEGNSGSPEGTFGVNEEYDPARDTWRNLAPHAHTTTWPLRNYRRQSRSLYRPEVRVRARSTPVHMRRSFFRLHRSRRLQMEAC